MWPESMKRFPRQSRNFKCVRTAARTSPRPCPIINRCARSIYSDASIDTTSTETDIANSGDLRAFLIGIGKKFGIKEGDYYSWYNVSNSMFKRVGGEAVKPNETTLFSLLSTAFPEHNWDQSKFRRRERNYWKSPENQRNHLLKLGELLNIKPGDYEAWYHVTNETLLQHEIASALNHGSFPNLLKSAFPEYPWDPSKFRRKARNYWDSPDAQRKALRELGEKLGFKEGDFDAWYKLSTKDFIRAGIASLLTVHNYSIYKILKENFPEHPWDVRRLSRRPRQYWKSEENLRAFLDEIGLKLGIQVGEYDKWYKVSAAKLRKLGAGSVLNIHRNSLPSLLSAAYPHISWDEARFSKKPQAYWASVENQRAILTEIGASLGINPGEYSKWYEVHSTMLLRTKAASPLVTYHNGSVASFVMTAFPEHDWQPHLFSSKRMPESTRVLVEE